MTLKISVIVPIYNQEKYLNRSIYSVINQTIGFENIELILIDDCSTDKSKNIIQKYAEKYENIIPIFLEENTGTPAIPRDTGIEKSTTDYIMFLDPDDEYIPDFCEIMYENITKNDVDLVKCNFIEIRNNKKTPNYHFEKNITEKIIKNTEPPLKYVTICNGIHKSSLLKEKKIKFPNYIGEDIYFTTKEFLNINKLLYLNNYFGYIYYDNEESHAKNPKTEKIKSLLKVFEKTRDLCKDLKREDVMNIILGRQFVGIFTRINNNKDSANIKKELLKETYKFRKTAPDLIIASRVYKIADSLLMKKLFYTTLIYLKIAPKIYHSKILYKIFNK